MHTSSEPSSDSINVDNDRFADILGAECAELQQRLITEHLHQVARLEAENTRLRREAQKDAATTIVNVGANRAGNARIVPHSQSDASDQRSLHSPSPDVPPAPPIQHLSSLTSSVLPPSVNTSFRSDIYRSGSAGPVRRDSTASGDSCNSTDALFEPLSDWTVGKDKQSLLKRRLSRAGSMLEVSSSLNDSAALRFASHEDSGCYGRAETYLRLLVVESSSVNNLCWGLCGWLFVCLDVLLIPLQVFDPPETDFLVAHSLVSRLYWAANLVKSFLTGYLGPENTEEVQPWKVARHYAKTWFAFDLLCVICDWLAPVLDGEVSATLHGIRLLRIVRTSYLMKLSELEEVIARYAHTETVGLCMNIVKIITSMLCVAHLIACGWYGVGRDGGADGWVAHHGLRTARLWDRYVWSLHWSLAQFTGEMIYEPQNITERGFAVLVLFLAFLLSALFVSSITTSMTRLMIVAGQTSSKLQALRRYLNDMRISTSLILRMQRNAQHAFEERRSSTPEMLECISEPLKVDFHYELHLPMLNPHPFFRMYNVVNSASIRKVCHSTISIAPLSCGDVVFSDSETPRARMFFVTGPGRLEYKQQGQPPRPLVRGQWACEQLLWTNWMHCGSLHAATECRLVEVDTEKFRSIVSAVPTRHASRYASLYVAQLNAADRNDISDLWKPDFDHILDNVVPEWQRGGDPPQSDIFHVPLAIPRTPKNHKPRTLGWLGMAGSSTTAVVPAPPGTIG